MTYNNIRDYVEAKLNWEQSLGRYEGGSYKVLVDGEWMPHSEYPMPQYERQERNNPDGTKLFNPCLTKHSKK